ncbi:MAG: DNA-binding protein WhiA [Butyricicoccus sp.]|nr:DNA-binding protein WhiA [Butyricicoccus sp.]
MSFSSRVKSELCRAPLSRSCCARAEAYGALLYANTFSFREIKIITGSTDFAQRLPRLMKKAFGLGFDAAGQPRRGSRAVFSITSPEKISAIFDCYGYDAESTLVHHINLGVLEDECCRCAFLRGAFLAGGSVTDPNLRSHLELVTEHTSVSRELYALLRELGFEPRESSRGAHRITYFKQSGAIEDFLSTIGATNSAMELMGAKVEKDMRNAINRRVNCDSANADKIVSAAQAQLEKIRALEREIGIKNLPEDLQQAAILRIANPEASLADLAALSSPPVSKSCINHRLRKLMSYEVK